MIYKERRRAHGLLLEAMVLEELKDEDIFEPIDDWPDMRFYADGQKYFISRNGSVENPLDQFGHLYTKDKTSCIPVILEVKAMRLIDWNDFRDNGNLHRDKLVQHHAHLEIARQHDFKGASIIAINKDSSEILIRTNDIHGDRLEDFSYEY